MSGAGVSRYETYSAAADERLRRGPREIDKNTHTDMCDGFDCPCYKDGWWMEATRHLDVLDMFCLHDPDLVRDRLTLAEEGTK